MTANMSKTHKKWKFYVGGGSFGFYIITALSFIMGGINLDEALDTATGDES